MPVTDGPQDHGADAPLLLDAASAFAPDTRHLGVAVSGGGDSVALLHLLHRVAAQGGYRLSAVTVDHRLRPESAAEAQGVARLCATLGIPHDTLIWRHDGAPTGNLMDQARRARRRLMADWAQARGIDRLALGHTADDQAETFLLGLSRSAGLDGLSGMRALWQDEAVCWVRPLLRQTRAALREYLRRHGIGWVDDPTNEDDRYARIRARHALAALAPLGITVDSLGASIRNLSISREALQHAARALAERVSEQAGALEVAVEDLHPVPADLRRRLLIAAILWINGADYPPRADDLGRLDAACLAGRDATLAGVRFRHRKGRLWITREARAAMGPVAMGQTWDHRWQIDGPCLPGAQIAALGGEGLAGVADWRRLGLPREALVVTPAIWQGGRLIAAPLAGFAGEWRAICRPSFASFILSH